MSEFQTDGSWLINRRSVVKLGAASLAASMVGLPKSARAEPEKGGHLRFGLPHGSSADSLDPGKIDNGFLFALVYAVFNNLVEIDPDGKAIGELAESFESDATAKIWTFKIRPGVEFHDGKPLSVEDVVASINFHRGPNTSSAMAPLLADVADVKADGSDKVVMTLSSGNVELPGVLASQGFFIKQAKDGKIDVASTVGTGAYKLEKFEPGVMATGVRNERYWKQGRGHADRMTLQTILDAAARTNALQTGEVDVIDGVDLKTIGLLKRNQKIRIDRVKGNLHYTFAMFTDAAPFKDNNVRMALKFGVDRQQLIDNVLSGYGSLGNDHPIGEAYPEKAASLEQRNYDPDKSKWHLKQAGLNQLDVSLSAADAAFTGAVDAATLYSESAKKAGININVIREPNDGYWSNVWMVKPFSAVFWGGLATAGAQLELAYAASAAWNDTHWKNGKFNQLLSASKTELDTAKRVNLFSEMQQLIRDDGGAVVPMFADLVLASSTKVNHGKLGSLIGIDNYRFVERWWVEP
ncbi:MULTISPECIES: ABC transporter substrate-binding protein [unclassified Mesorhizobium]|uniref:ABC transporter substrate-binding protein n=1 Tax=unclassified Mesorhizobium TaxID=325217 RepID=UPI001CCE75AF|nr:MULTISPECIES: ABC transporter substrate-binding protein [unclassified Mesorhizobium]MBZ9820591.1 ABC transporter substrate-binding protein [Mesorhizobium sp. CA4]